MNPAAGTPGRRLVTRRFHNRITRTMLLVLLPVTLIPVLLMGGTTFARSRELLRQQVATTLEETLHAQASQIEAWSRRQHIRLDMGTRHTDTQEALQALLAQPAPSGGEFDRYRSQLLGSLEDVTQRDLQLIFNQFLLLSPQGRVVAASQPDWQGLDLAADPNVRRLVGQRASQTTYSLPPLYDEQIITLTSQPVQDGQGRALGTVVGISEPGNLLRRLGSTPLTTPGASAHFVTEQGEFIGINPYRQELTRLQPSKEQMETIAPLQQDYRHGEKQGAEHYVVEVASFDGETVVASYTWLPSVNVGIGLQVPQGQVFGELNSLTGFTLSLLAGLAVLIALVTWFGTHRLVNPLISLTRTIQGFAEGDWSQRAATERSDEIGLLGYTFNQMADQLSRLYASLEEEVSERSRQIRTAAEVAQIATSTTRLEELLDRTVNLLVERFGFHQVSIYLLDETRTRAVLRRTAGQSADPALAGLTADYQVGSEATIGWVVANNQPRVSDRSLSPLDPGEVDGAARALIEAGVPIAVGDEMLGALLVESLEAGSFDPEGLAVLQTLANQVASAINAVRLLETTRVDLRLTNTLANAGRMILASENDSELVEALEQILPELLFSAGFYRADANGFSLMGHNLPDTPGAPALAPRLSVTAQNLALYLSDRGPLVVSSTDEAVNLPLELQSLPGRLGTPYAVVIPVYRQSSLQLLLVMGAHQKEAMRSETLQPYLGLAELVALAIEKITALQDTRRRLHELQALESITQVVAQETGLTDLYQKIHQQIQGLLGEVDFLIALYDSNTRQIEIPYAAEGEHTLQIDPFPLGQGLTSVVIRTRRPLLLNESDPQRLQSLGARVIGEPAKSWLGVPLILAEQVIGVYAVQDLEQEGRFDERDQRLLSSLAPQFATSLRNARLLEETHHRAVQLEIASQISRDVSQTLDLDDLLQKAINLVRDRFGFYHASVFLLDRSRTHAVVRQSTGPVGEQMMAEGHRLAVGSKSIIGSVTEQGKPLVVNDVSKDPTHRPHPLLPETRAELGIPLRIGPRVLGALDVQSSQAFAFSADDVAVLQLLADQLAVAVANAELFGETQEHLAQQRLLHHVTTAAASSTRVQDALFSAAQGLNATLGGDQVRILLVDEGGKGLILTAAAGFEDQDPPAMRLQVGKGAWGQVAAQRQAVLLNDLPDDGFDYEIYGLARSLLAVPLVYRAELLGVLSVESLQAGAYDANDQEMLTTLGGTLAAIIANTRLIERQQKLFEVTSKIRRSTSIQQVMETTVKELGQAMGARRARLDLGLQHPAPVGLSPEDQENGSNGL